MENKEDVPFCKLCLKSCDRSFVNVNESRGKILDALFPTLNVKVRDVLCQNCAESLQTSFEFKSNCLYVEECINSFMNNDENEKVEIKAVYLSMNKCKDEFNTEEDYTVCRLCMKQSNCMLLNEIGRGEISISKIVEKCIPELDISSTKDPVICRSCCACLYDYFSLLKNHSEVGQKVREYGEIERINGQNEIKLNNVLEFSGSNMTNFGSNFIDVNRYENEEDSKVVYNDGNFMDTELPELNIKHEKVYIKMDKEMMEENVLDCKSDHINVNMSSECCENERSEIAIKYETVEINEIDKVEVECTPKNALSCKSQYSDTLKHFQEKEKEGEFMLKNSKTLNIKLEDTEIITEENDDTRFQHNTSSSQPELQQVVIYTDSSGVKYKCGMCGYETKYKHILTNSHLPIHKDAEDVTMHQCDICNYKTKYKNHLKRHMIVHKDPSEVTFYSCEACDFKTKYAKSMKEHLLTHRQSSETTMYECDKCKFKTKHKRSLQGHMLVHKSASERTIYECELCTYKSKRKQCLDRHVLTHKSDSDITWYQCDVCEYKAMHRVGLNRHKIIHKNVSELKLHQCPVCTYITRYVSHLSTHMLMHKDVSNVTMHRCEICGLKTKYKTSLKKHLLLHKDVAEVPVYQCDTCDFRTRHKVSLKIHALTHKGSSEVKIYECYVCEFKTKYKRSLKQHMVVHISDVIAPR